MFLKLPSEYKPSTLVSPCLGLDQKVYCLSLNRGPWPSESEAWPHVGSFSVRHPYEKRVRYLQARGKASVIKISIMTSKCVPRAVCWELCLICTGATCPTIWAEQMLPRFQMKNREVGDWANVLPLAVMGAWWKADSKAHSYFRSGGWLCSFHFHYPSSRENWFPMQRKLKKCVS